jgi:hypothetical protein
MKYPPMYEYDEVFQDVTVKLKVGQVEGAEFGARKVARGAFSLASLMIVSPDCCVDSETECAEAPYSDRNIETCRTKRSGYWYSAPWPASG